MKPERIQTDLPERPPEHGEARRFLVREIDFQNVSAACGFPNRIVPYLDRVKPTPRFLIQGKRVRMEIQVPEGEDGLLEAAAYARVLEQAAE